MTSSRKEIGKICSNWRKLMKSHWKIESLGRKFHQNYENFLDKVYFLHDCSKIQNIHWWQPMLESLLQVLPHHWLGLIKESRFLLPGLAWIENISWDLLLWRRASVSHISISRQALAAHVWWKKKKFMMFSQDN